MLTRGGAQQPSLSLIMPGSRVRVPAFPPFSSGPFRLNSLINRTCSVTSFSPPNAPAAPKACLAVREVFIEDVIVQPNFVDAFQAPQESVIWKFVREGKRALITSNDVGLRSPAILHVKVCAATDGVLRAGLEFRHVRSARSAWENSGVREVPVVLRVERGEKRLAAFSNVCLPPGSILPVVGFPRTRRTS